MTPLISAVRAHFQGRDRFASANQFQPRLFCNADGSGDFYVTYAIVLGELFAGFKGGIREVENRKELDQFLDSPRVVILGIDESSADFFALVFNNLKQVGKPIPTNDIWIAASAMQHGRTLVTMDHHFSYVAGLSIHPALERITL